MPPAEEHRAPSDRGGRARSAATAGSDARGALVDAALRIIRDEGVRGVAVADVLDRCGLGTRAFYRTFGSKDDLLAAVFVEVARAEARRSVDKIGAAAGAVDAVAAWIDGRLDLAFDPDVRSDLRLLSEEAQALMFSSPTLVHGAFAELLAPLVEQLARGVDDGVFVDVDPEHDARMIHGAVWACISHQWVTGDAVRPDARSRVVRTCLRGLGVQPQTVAATLTRQERRRRGETASQRRGTTPWGKGS